MILNVNNSIVTDENLFLCYKNASKSHVKYNLDTIYFHQNWAYNLNQLKNELLTGNYKPSSYHEFTVYDPKERIIQAPQFRDKIVHHLISLAMNDFFTKIFIKDSYACIINKGQLKALKQMEHYHQLISKKVEEPYVIKIDIKKYFYTISHSILIDELSKYIKDFWFLNLLITIITYNNHNQVGLPLGNLTSQLFANIYLNPLDHYVKRTLRLPYYIRYNDDLILFTNNKTEAENYLKLIGIYIIRKLHLSLHIDKTYVYPLKNGTHHLGFSLYKKGLFRFFDGKKKITHFLEYLLAYYQQGYSKTDLQQSLNSQLSYLKYGHYKKFYDYLLHSFPFLYQKNELLIIDFDFFNR